MAKDIIICGHQVTNIQTRDVWVCPTSQSPSAITNGWQNAANSPLFNGLHLPYTYLFEWTKKSGVSKILAIEVNPNPQLSKMQYAWDALNWHTPTPISIGHIYGAKCIHKKNNGKTFMYISGGQTNSSLTGEIIRSQDGINWIAVSNVLPPIAGHNMISFNNMLIIAGGVNGSGGWYDLFYSVDDGVSWVALSVFNVPQNNPCMVIHTDGITGVEYLYIYGNAYNKVWRSSDGINYSVICNNQYSSGPRTNAIGVSDGDYMYSISGDIFGNVPCNEIYRSLDGKSWLIQPPPQPFTSTNYIHVGGRPNGSATTCKLDSKWY